MTAPAIARELEVSVRTVLRDVEALSSAGIPVYAERGPHGGFALLPGFTTDLTGLTVDEATALLAASTSADTSALGMAPAFAAAMRKVTDALPEAGRTAAIRASERILVTGAGWITEAPVDPNLGRVQQAVFDGVRLRIRYRPRERDAGWRTVDPIGVVSAAGRWYLVALHRGDERTYRLSRIDEVKVLDVPAERPSDVDLAEIWNRRRTQFRAGMSTISATVRVRESRRDELATVAISLAECRADGGHADGEGWCRAEVEFGSSAHAGAVMWQLGDDAELMAPLDLRDEIRTRALRLSTRHG